MYHIALPESLCKVGELPLIILCVSCVLDGRFSHLMITILRVIQLIELLVIISPVSQVQVLV